MLGNNETLYKPMKFCALTLKDIGYGPQLKWPFLALLPNIEKKKCLKSRFYARLNVSYHQC
jgi:hypothetical protein